MNMTIIFALFFLLLGFIGGLFVACSFTLDMLRDHAKEGRTFLDRFRITLIGEERQE
jgi:hypothetical protein